MYWNFGLLLGRLGLIGFIGTILLGIGLLLFSLPPYGWWIAACFIIPAVIVILGQE